MSNIKHIRIIKITIVYIDSIDSRFLKGSSSIKYFLINLINYDSSIDS